MPALGEQFRSAREARGLSVSNVAEQIHIRSVYLAAIENEDWTSIGAPVYVRGFIRTYARYLSLDAEAAVARFNETVPAARPSHAVAPGPARERTRPSLWVLLGGLVAVVLVGYVVYEYVALRSPGARTLAVRPASAPPSPATGARPRPATNRPLKPVAHHQLAVRLVQRSWLRIAVDGQTKLEGIYPAGTAKAFSGKAAEVRAGNAGGVTVSVNGSAAKPLGKVGDVVERRYSL